MRTKIKLLFTAILLAGSVFVLGQQKMISGQVTDSDGFPVADAYVYVDGTDNGVYTDSDGNYTLSVNQGDEVAIEFIGFETKTIAVGTTDRYNVSISRGGAIELSSTIATALGIQRDKKALGYSAQEVDGDLLNASKSNNALASLSGNVAGVQISTPSGNMGGSARVLLRGTASVTGENKPLIVVDGIPISNENFNSTAAQRGAGGRDYGDLGFDIDPTNIEKVTVLKGGAASALYGSRGANGVVLITTKSGAKQDAVEFNTGVSFESVSLFPKLQNQYGGGSMDEFETINVNGQTYNIVEYTEDVSWGPKYDPNTSVLHWDAFDPDDAANYMKPRPWVAPIKGAETFFNTGVSYNNNVSFSKSFDKTNARVSYSNLYVDGFFPNSKLTKNSFNVDVTTKFSDKFTAKGNMTYVNTNAFNRPEVGYGDNSVPQKMFQWGQRQLDWGRMKANYMAADGSQKSWNRTAWDNAKPAYSDNPYWTVFNNTSKDERSRYLGNFQLKYDITDNLYAVTNVYGDGYTITGSEIVAYGSQAVSGYSIFNRMAREFNYEGRLHFDKNFGDISLNSFVGGNIRDEHYKRLSSETNGGLVVPGLYNLDNSKDPATSTNFLREKRVNSLYGMLSLGYRDFLFVEATARNDWSSTLPEDNNSYFYPSVSTSVILSEFVSEPWMRFWKVRGAWARTGNDTDPYKLVDTFTAGDNFLGSPAFSLNTEKKNEFLLPETTDSWEFGMEMSLFKDRVYFDVTYYDQYSRDLLMPVQVSPGTGSDRVFANSAEMSNKGIEALVRVTPVKTENFSWSLTWNFAKNKNMVEKLNEAVPALKITNATFRAQLWAVEGKEYGQIRGKDFVYDDQGNPVVLGNGMYAATPIKDLGSVLPDYNMGLRNTVTYKNISLSFLIDMQKGGKYFSLTNMWGMYSGMLEETVANGIRETGITLPGVTGTVAYDDDGNYTVSNTATNTNNISADDYGYNFYVGPDVQNIFDADYFKLRDVTLTYALPKNIIGPFKGVDVSFFGRNLFMWGLDNKNFDPEQTTTGSGNIQGLEGGSLPPTRTYGMNLKLQF